MWQSTHPNPCWSPLSSACHCIDLVRRARCQRSRSQGQISAGSGPSRGGGCSTRAKSSHTTRAVLPARNEPQTGHDTGGRSCCNEAQRRTSSVIISSNSTMFSGPEQNIFSAWQKGIYLPPKCQRCALTHGGRLAVDYHRTVQAACTYVYLDVVYVRGGVCARVTLLWCPLCLSAQP